MDKILNKSRLIIYTILLFLFSIFLIFINLKLNINCFEYKINVLSICVFSILNIILYLNPIPIMDNEEEKTIGMDFFINIVSLLIFGYITAIISSSAGSIYYLLTKYTNKKDIKEIYRPLISLFSITVSVSIMNIVYFLLGGDFGSNLSSENIIAIIIASLLNFALNALILSVAINMTQNNNFIKSLSIFKDYFLWLYKYFLWDGIYAFLYSMILLLIYKSDINFKYFFILIIGTVLLYPIGQRIGSFKLNVKYNKQNKDLTDLNAQLKSTNEIIINAFLSSLEAKDTYTKEHSVRVSEYAVILAKELDFTEEKLKTIKIAGLLHDIGKMKISENIINKTGSLTDDEYIQMKNHPTFGLEMLEKIFEGTDIDHDDFQLIANITSMHHERFDGRGYPNRIAENQIPIEGRILAVVDTFDAMTSTRSYRKALTLEEAKKEIEKNIGTQFCPIVSKKFIECINENKIKILKI